MEAFITVVVWGAISFAATDYTLGRLTVKDPLRAILAAVVAVLYVSIVLIAKTVRL